MPLFKKKKITPIESVELKPPSNKPVKKTKRKSKIKRKDRAIGKTPRTGFKGTSNLVTINKQIDTKLLQHLIRTNQITITDKQRESKNRNKIIQKKYNRILVNNKKIRFGRKELPINELRDEKRNLFIKEQIDDEERTERVQQEIKLIKEKN